MYGMSVENNASLLLGVIMRMNSSESLLGRDDISFFTVQFSEGMEVALTAIQVDDDGALGDVVGGGIGRADVGVVLIIYEGTEVALTASEVNGDGALGGVISFDLHA